MKFSQAIAFLFFLVITALAIPIEDYNSLDIRSFIDETDLSLSDFSKRAGGGGGGGAAAGGTLRFQRVQAAIAGLNLQPGTYAFYRKWPQGTFGPKHPDLIALTSAIDGAHYALVVGTLSATDFVGVSVDLRFTSPTTALQKPNGNGAPIQGTAVQFATNANDASTLHFLGRVTQVAQATVQGHVAAALNGNVYNVQTNNCKTFVDRMFQLLQ